MPYTGLGPKKAAALRAAICALFLVLLAARPARAQLQGLDLFLRSGPSIAPMLTLQDRVTGVDPGFLLRLGILSGLPLQVEASFSRSTIESGRGVNAVLGVRVLPAHWSSEEGFSGMGGRPGHNLGLLAGFSLTGGYVGATYEWLVVDEAGVVAEVTKAFGGLLASPVSFNLGLKARWPLGRSLL